MKNILNKIVVLTLFASAFSCTDLAEEPVGLLAPESFFKTAKDVETSIYGAYGLAASEEYYGRKLSLSLLLRGDMADIGDRKTPARRQQVNDFNMDSNNDMVTSFWPRSYQIIAAANVALEGANSLTLGEEVLNPLKAEAMFMRAFVYYHLVRLFGEVPLVLQPVVDIEAARTMSKSSVADIYKLIKEDLEYGKQWLPDTYSNNLRTRPTKASAAAYLASMHLTLGDFSEAYKEAKWVIDNEVKFDLNLESNFQDLFNATKQDKQKEILFALDFLGLNTGEYNTNQDYLGSVTGPRAVSNGEDIEEGWSVAVPTMEVFNTWDSRDYRKKVSFMDSGMVKGVWSGYDKFAPNHGSARPHIAKYFRYPGKSGINANDADTNVPCMRYAEVLLIAAEALNQTSGPNAEAEGYINRIRERARNWDGTIVDFPANVSTGLGKAAFHDLVIEERRLELAFEFKRWYDIKRLQIGDEVFKGPGSLEPHPTFDATRDYFFPLPQDELDRNENLKPQNSGY
ncbi:MAG: RagB/SusD family nutrient uptake outer membrane protein [Cyclobacteriaceae bacterium]|nr:RagB/SusD family nutrient uptake outer membrane protein [Cyclobacteriaceae bacterium]